MIDVTLLGTAALAPIPERALSSAFLRCGGRSILFDCGEGTQSAARKAGVSLINTDIIALTHYHGDHIFGLPGLLQTMFSAGRIAPLYVTGPDGLDDVMSVMLRLAGDLSFDVETFETPDDGLWLREYFYCWPDRAVLSSFPTNHRGKSQGYSFTLGRAGKFNPEKAIALGIPVESWRTIQNGGYVLSGDGQPVAPKTILGPDRKGLKVVFTGDTTMYSPMTKAAKDADLLICDATYGDDEQTELAVEHGHMTFSQAAMTAKLSGSKTLWLTHYSQRVTRPEYFLPVAKKIFPDTVCGYDGLSVTLRFEE